MPLTIKKFGVHGLTAYSIYMWYTQSFRKLGVRRHLSSASSIEDLAALPYRLTPHNIAATVLHEPGICCKLTPMNSKHCQGLLADLLSLFFGS